MNAPDKKAFDDFRTQARYRAVWFEAEREALGKVEEATPADFKAFVEAVLIKCEQIRKKVFDHEVIEWIQNESGYTKASQLMFSKDKGPRSFDEEVTHEVNQIIEMDPRFRLRRILSLSRYEPLRAWVSHNVLAVEDYLYSDHDRIVTAHKALIKNAEKIKQLWSEIEPFADSCQHRLPRLFVLHDVASDIDKLMGYANEYVPRAQQTAAEVSYVRRMCMVNRRFKRTPKPPVIAELMTMSCFARQFDVRHIARICAEMTRNAGSR